MSGVEISSGGAVAVDAAELQAAADTLDAVTAQVREAGNHVDRARMLLSLTMFDATSALAETRRAAEDLEELAVMSARLAAGLRTSAAAYDLVELTIERDAAQARGGHTLVAHLDAEIARLRAQYPEAAEVADEALAGHGGGDAAIAQLGLLGAFGAAVGLAVPIGAAATLFAGLVAGIRGTGFGRIDRDRAIAGEAGAVPLRRLETAGAARAPATLAAALSRIPQAGEARVRVERYDMPGGSRSFAVYVTGTQALAGRDPWNMPANVRLFTGRDAPSLATVEAALARAGARPGDELFAFGHSQGGMIVDALAAEGVYDTAVLATAGSPTAYDAGTETFSVQLRHDDDPVAALADGGQPQRVGGEDSFVATRTADPAVGIQDLGVVAHHLDAYVETAGMVDESGDPRAAALHDRLSALGEAEEVTVYEFAPAPDRSPAAPEPSPGPAPEPSTR